MHTPLNTLFQYTYFCGIIRIFDTQWTLPIKREDLTVIHSMELLENRCWFLLNCINPADGAYFDRPWDQRTDLAGRVTSLDTVVGPGWLGMGAGEAIIHVTRPRLTFQERRVSSIHVLTLLERARFIALRLKCLFWRKWRPDPWHFGECGAWLGNSPAPGPTLKRPCTTLKRLMGSAANTGGSKWLLMFCLIFWHTPAGCGISRMDLVRWVTSLEAVVSRGSLSWVPGRPSIHITQQKLTLLQSQGAVHPRL